MMDRRAFIAIVGGSILAAPLATRAQQAGEIHRIGYLAVRSADDSLPFREALRQGLSDLGGIEGRNIAIEYRYAEGKYDRMPTLAAELVRLKVDVLVAEGTAAAVAAKNATQTIPI